MTEENLYKQIIRRETKTCKVGNVKIGSRYPISIQSMTNTKTTDIKNTLKQINDCHEEGVDLMRVSVPNYESIDAFEEICKNSPVPIIADLHFNTFLKKVYRKVIEKGASCIRINPGTMTPRGNSPELIKKSNMALRDMVSVLKDYNCAVRIGVNVGSLEENILDKYKYPSPEAMVESSLNQLAIFEEMDFSNLKISVKASDVMLMIRSYQLLSKKTDYPLHLGVTESGPIFSGTVKSSIGIGSLIFQGIGDTIRISLSDDIREEIRVARQILKSLGLVKKGVDIVSCPSCARQEFDVISVVKEIESKVSNIKEYIKFSILGCVVNGLGEAKESDIGITGARNGKHIIYVDGKKFGNCSSEELISVSVKLIKEKSSQIRNTN